MNWHPNGNGRARSNMLWHRGIVTLLFIYLLLPVAATLLFALATEWQTTVLPEGYTLHWFVQLFGETRFLEAIGRSFLVSFITVALSLLIMVPAVFVISIYFPRLERGMQVLALLPFAFPGVVAAVGLIKLYSSGPIAISGTIWILVGAYFIVIQPYVYQSTRNSLRALRAGELMEAAEVLGAGKRRAFLHVILPNIAPGLIIASLLSFSILFGEFVLGNMLVGGSYETIQIYLYRMMTVSGHIASATIITFFVIVFILSGIVLKLGQWSEKRTKSVPQLKEEEG